MNRRIHGNLHSRTSWTAMALVILGAIQQALPQWVDIIPDGYEGMAVSIIGALMFFLRNITHQPITNRGGSTNA